MCKFSLSLKRILNMMLCCIHLVNVKNVSPKEQKFALMFSIINEFERTQIYVG